MLNNQSQLIEQRLRRLALGGIVGLLAFSSTFASAAVGDRHNDGYIGSAGTVDESGLDKVQMKSGRVMIRNSVNSGSVVLRYPIKIGNGTLAISEAKLYARYKDNGSDAQIIVKLKSANLYTGDVTTHATWDSNTQDQSDDYQADYVIYDHAPGWDHGYYWSDMFWVEVKLIKSGSAGRPAFAGFEYWVIEG